LKRSVAVQIAGQRYVIKTDADEAYVSALARYVDEKIDEARKVTRTVSTHQVVILAALNIADDLFRAEREGGELRRMVRERTQDVLKYVEQEAKASENQET
jgi:cell division protein ZapA